MIYPVDCLYHYNNICEKRIKISLSFLFHSFLKSALVLQYTDEWLNQLQNGCKNGLKMRRVTVQLRQIIHNLRRVRTNLPRKLGLIHGG